MLVNSIMLRFFSFLLPADPSIRRPRVPRVVFSLMKQSLNSPYAGRQQMKRQKRLPSKHNNPAKLSTSRLASSFSFFVCAQNLFLPSLDTTTASVSISDLKSMNEFFGFDSEPETGLADFFPLLPDVVLSQSADFRLRIINSSAMIKEQNTKSFFRLQDSLF